MAAVLVLSVGGAIVPALLAFTVLQPSAVWSGQLWRLLTWGLLEFHPLNLVFGLILLYAFSPDLLYRWGVRGFILRYFGCGVLVGALSCLVLAPFSASPLASLAQRPFTGLFAISEAMIIAWGSLVPDRQILFFFMIPMSGRNLIFASIAITVIFAAMGGFVFYIPVFIAIAVALIYMDVFSFRRLYLRGRMAMLQRDYKKKTSNLRAVDRDRDEPPRWTH